ncbi:nitronate monooxygenase [Microbacterium stercoris]|uniref:Nitronate monooxygenase n=1 Tax=Microbacterium stercoris TaxID=2820289 RepID=A0A939QHA3_9MICO|nr:nitronate monooxygenase [Microbacterium stercoris]MBO3662793.1 nitronate monooxygenase [Microbacterium stercoris]
MSSPARALPFDARFAIVNAPMGGVAGGALASAVTRAGGLGMIGQGSAGSVASLTAQLALVPEGVRVGIGVVDWVVRRDPALLELALDADPVLLSVGFGDELDWIRRAQDRGILTAVQVFDGEGARAADAAGADVIVVRGREAGGHGRHLVDRDALLDETLSVTDRPVLAAGAIATAADVRAALDRGASGVWVGTAFTTAVEALSSRGSRAALLAAGPDDTVLTSVFDQAAGWGWPSDIPERVLANAFTARWASGASPVARAEFAAAGAHDDPRGMSVNAGLGVGHLTEELPAADVLGALAAGL